MIPIDNEQIQLLEQRLRGAGVDRRTFLKIASAATAGPLAVSLLAACGGSDNKATATKPAAVAPTNTTGTPAPAATATTAAPASSPTAAATAAASPTTA